MFIWTQFIDQLPVGLLAQLVERCTGIAEVMGSNPVQAWIFFSSVLSCEDLLISKHYLVHWFKWKQAHGPIINNTLQE